MTIRQHHVLLIGIDAYDGGGSLNGCVNDIDAIQRLLLNRVGVDPGHITRLASPRTDAKHEEGVTEQLPTLENIRAALAKLSSDEVTADHRVLVYYSGHGTQCSVTDASGHRFAREALLPKDKLLDGKRQFLFDWEINRAIARIAARTQRTTVILDCCSSAGVTRGPDDASDGTRFLPTREPVFLDNVALGPSKRGVAAALGSVAQCQVIAACRDDQRARESVGTGGMAQGELTRALIAQLDAIADNELLKVHWGRVWRAVDLAVRRASPNQAPWLFGRFGGRIFGFDADEDGDAGYAMVQVPGGFAFDAGTLQGVTEGAVIGVYDALPATFPPLGTPADTAAQVGRIRITRANAAQSSGTALAPFRIPTAPRGRLVVAGRDARLRVRVDPADAAVEALLTSSPLLELVSSGEEVALSRRSDGAWAVTDDVHGKGERPDDPVLAIIPVDRLVAVRPVLEHYLAYITPLRMARACTDLPGALSISVLDCKGAVQIDPEAAQAGALPVVRDLKEGARVCFAIENTAEIVLSVALFDCAPSGRVILLSEPRVPAAVLQRDGTKISGRYIVWSDAVIGRPFTASLPTARSVGIERLVAIGTTSETASLVALKRGTTFASIVSPARSRGVTAVRSAVGAAPTLHQWTSSTSSLRVDAGNAAGRGTQ